MITTPKATRKYRSVLPSLIDSLNRGDFERRFLGESAPTLSIKQGPSISTFKMENELTRIRKQGEERTYQNGEYTVIVRKNITKRIRTPSS